MVQLNSTSRYFLKNKALGGSFALASAPSNDSLVIVSLGVDNSKQWYFSETGISDYFYLHTVEKGDWVVLDVFNDNGILLEFHFFPRHGASGQYWTMQDQSDGTVKLSNNFTGNSLFLDIDLVKLTPRLALGDRAGMRWTVSEVTATASDSSTMPITTTTTPSIHTSGGTRTLTPTSHDSRVTGPPSLPGAQKHAISGGAIAGIVIGVLAPIVALAFIAYYLRKRKYRKDSFPPMRGVVERPVLHTQD